jgi:Zn-dependent membrane protease YugP
MMEAILIFDQLWWFALPGLLLGLYAQAKLTSAYRRYSQVPTNSGLSGAEAAREILDSAGLSGMPINEVGGHLTDHYDPTKKTLFLSSENFHGRTLAAVGVAAHEAGHALQHKAAYAPLHLRMALVPVTRIATTAAVWMFGLAMFIHFAKLAMVGVVIFGIIFLFQLITLPVEFDASRRAKDQLINLGLVDGQERAGVSKVLGAAAMTYVAAMVGAFFDLLHFIMIARGNNRS